jgi:L-lactate utilization protein LutC
MSEKESFLSKTKRWFLRKPTSSEVKEETEGRELSKSKYLPEEKDPVDVRFARAFTKYSGKFLYCSSEEELISGLHAVIGEYGFEEVYCHDASLFSVLDRAGVSHMSSDPLQYDGFVHGCEFLIAFNGGIMVTSAQTNGKKLDKLPSQHIVIGYTSQIVENLGEGLKGIRERYKGRDIPSMITDISGPKLQGESSDNKYLSDDQKDVFLLLVEDQL